MARELNTCQKINYEVIIRNRQALASTCVLVNAHDFPSAHGKIACLRCSVMFTHSFLKQGVPGSMLLSGMFFFRDVSTRLVARLGRSRSEYMTFQRLALV